MIYLEAEALGQAPPDFAVHLLGDLLAAAQTLGLRSLQVRSSLFPPFLFLDLQHAVLACMLCLFWHACCA